MNAGAQLDVKLSDKLSLIAELQGTIVDESFDGQIGGFSSKKNRTVEGYGSLSIGITYKFGGQKFNRYTKVNPVVLESVYYTPAPVVVEVPAAEPEILVTEFPVRFLIDQSTIEEVDDEHPSGCRLFERRHPKARLKLSGYADKETAYPAYNMKLSERRVKAVKDCLVKEFNIDPDRLQTIAKGDIERAYEEDYRWNRAVVMEIIEDETENK
ncbi:MAG: OmpA family protein [Parabacteroides johnsonii]